MRNRIKNRITQLYFLTVILYSCSVQSQDYTFKNYVDDEKILDHLQSFESFDKLDSVKYYFKQYRNNLRYHKYLYTSILLNEKGDNRANQYLDSAFRLGMAFRCMQRGLFKKFDVEYVNASYKKNYLKGFDGRAIEIFDSIKTEDQKYRSLFYQSDARSRDSLYKLQAKIDSSNFTFYKKYMAENGFPGFKKVGMNICSYPSPSSDIVIIHLNLTERPFQIQLIRQLMEACKKQEEDWHYAISQLTNLYFRSNHHFSEFNFLKFSGNKLDADESLLSIYCMSDWLIKSPSDKIVIRCRDAYLFESIKSEMLKMNDVIKIPFVDEAASKQFHIAIPKKLDSTSFSFEVADKEENDKVLYKFVHK